MIAVQVDTLESENCCENIDSTRLAADKISKIIVKFVMCPSLEKNQQQKLDQNCKFIMLAL